MLAGIVVGTVLGLAFHSARLLLVEGSVPTAVFGLGCLGSLWTPRPLMFGFALEFAGPDTATGQEMTRLWQYEGYRRVFRVITAAWGVALLVEAGLRVVVIYNTSTTTALLLSKIMAYGSIAILCAWTVGYGTQQKKRANAWPPMRYQASRRTSRAPTRSSSAFRKYANERPPRHGPGKFVFWRLMFLVSD